jgi:RNA polymerase sigma-70 factor (ECF subfamily)
MTRTDTREEQRDRVLMERIARGDKEALASLYDRYAAAAFGVASKICGTRTLAEDAVQEAFLSIWRRPGSYNPQRGSVTSYLFGAVHNKAVDAIRHEQSLRRREQAMTDRPEGWGGEEVVEAAWLSVRRVQVRSALQRLSKAQREALQMAYFEGVTYAEVAERLGIPLGTAKTRIRDGMIQLRALLSASGVEE